MRVNLIAKKRGGLLTIEWTRVIITILISCFIFALVFNFFLMRNEVNILRQEANIIDEQLDVYLPKQQDYLKLEKKLEELKKKPEVNISEYLWDEILIELGYIIPSGSLLTGMAINTNNISIYGRASESENLLQIRERMKSSPLFKIVTITKIDKQEDIIFHINSRLAKGGD